MLDVKVFHVIQGPCMSCHLDQNPWFLPPTSPRPLLPRCRLFANIPKRIINQKAHQVLMKNTRHSKNENHTQSILTSFVSPTNFATPRPG